LQQTGVISNVAEDWLTFKADDTNRFDIWAFKHFLSLTLNLV
jgi:hypothetical protein